MGNTQRWGAEVFGTFWLVLGGCGTAVLAGLRVGNLGVALAFGLTVLTMAYAVGHISGAHFNPAVTIGTWLGRRIETKHVAPYLVAQLVGAVLAGGVLLLIARGAPGFVADTGDPGSFATNGYGDLSPGAYSLLACFLCEIVMTAFFLIVILGATDKRAPANVAPIAIGFTLTLIHLISIPVTNTSVNPARSLGVAVYAGMEPVKQLWFFFLAPIVGAVLGVLVYDRILTSAGPADGGQVAEDVTSESEG